MKQLLLIILSILLGYLYAYITKLNNTKMFILTILFTLIYIYILFLLNDGIINYILKIALILGYILNYKCKTLIKKCKP